jgi:hypothetical protein
MDVLTILPIHKHGVLFHCLCVCVCLCTMISFICVWPFSCLNLFQNTSLCILWIGFYFFSSGSLSLVYKMLLVSVFIFLSFNLMKFISSYSIFNRIFRIFYVKDLDTLSFSSLIIINMIYCIEFNKSDERRHLCFVSSLWGNIFSFS